MPTYRLVIRRTSIDHETIEVDAPSALVAAVKGENYADEKYNARKGVRVTGTFDDDQRATVQRAVASVKEL